MEFFVKLLKRVGTIFGLCLSAGVIVSNVEKKKGWVEGHKPGFYEKNVKRALDLGISLFAMFFLWPVFLITGIMVRAKLGSPIFFKQERPGLGGEIFEIRKFRTMTDAKDSNGSLLSDEERLTGFGKILRRTSLDELPELLNIVQGDMAIVGPRPLLVDYLPYYTEKERKRHDVRPGLTGLAQVHGRNALNWEKRFEMDVSYAACVTFSEDLKIIIDTIWAVISEKDIKINGLEDFNVYRKRQMENKVGMEYTNL